MIYFDQAATSLLKPKEVGDAVIDAMYSIGNCARGVNRHSLKASRTVYHVREQLSELFHVSDCSRIAFTCNSTESLNMAIKGLFGVNDHVITTVLEHNSVLRPLYELMDQGLAVTFLPADSFGNINYDMIESEIRPDTKAVICTHGSNVTGNLIDLKRIGRICKEHKLLFMVDASQTAGVWDIDVNEMNIDVLCFTGHKSLLGPQGTGGIYVREGLEVKPLKTGGSGILTFSKEHPKEMPERLEAGTLNGHGIAGLGAALSYIKRTNMSNIRNKELDLMTYFYEEVSKIPDIIIYGDFRTGNRCPIVSLNISGMDSSEVADILYDEYDISVRAGGHCAPLMHRALGTDHCGAVRFSFSSFNTFSEVDEAVKALKTMIRENR